MGFLKTKSKQKYKYLFSQQQQQAAVKVFQKKKKVHRINFNIIIFISKFYYDALWMEEKKAFPMKLTFSEPLHSSPNC